MRRLIVLVLLLVGCSPVQTSGVVPVERQVGPEEAARIIYDYTSTARVAATAAAGATATAVADRETATAGWAQTADALAVTATVQALAGLAAGGTRAAQVTDEAGTQQAGVTEAASTRQAGALATSDAMAEAERQRRDVEAVNWSAFWVTLRWIIVAGIGGVVCVLLGGLIMRHYFVLEALRLRERARIAREALQLLPPHYYTRWDEGQGRVVVEQLPGAIDGTARVIENHETAPHLAHAWRMAYRRFVGAGNRYGFKVRDLGPEGRQVVSDEGWRILTADLVVVGVLDKRGGTGWAAGWDIDRFGREGAMLPYPTHGEEEPPEVAIAGVAHHSTTVGGAAPHAPQAHSTTGG